MDNNSSGEESNAEHEPNVNVFKVGCARKGREGLRVQGDEGEQGGEAHHATVLEAVEWQEEGGVTNEVEEDGWEKGGEEVMCRATVETEVEGSCTAMVL